MNAKHGGWQERCEAEFDSTTDMDEEPPVSPFEKFIVIALLISMFRVFVRGLLK